MIQLEGWFKSWVPDSVFSAGGGRGSVKAWYVTALDVEEVPALSIISMFAYVLSLRQALVSPGLGLVGFSRGAF